MSNPIIEALGPTRLAPEEEQRYQRWKSTLPKNLQFEGDYDLRGFYKKNPTFSVANPSDHMTDEFKMPNHPTFSDESRFYNDKTQARGGHWDGDKYIPNDFVRPIQDEGPKQRPLHEIISDAVDAGLSDSEIKAAVARRKASAPPAFKLTEFAPENKAGPLAQSQQDADMRLSKDPLAEGDAVMEDPRWQRFTGNTPADNVERERQAQARGFAQFAVGQAVGPLATGALMKAGASPAVANVAGGAATGALPSAMAGNGPGEILKDAALGAAIPAIGAASTAVGKGILASKGGQARQLIEGHGGNVGVADSGSGLPEFQGRGKITDADIGEASRTAGEKLIAANDKRFDVEGRRPYKAGRSEIDRGQGRNLVSIIPIRRAMMEVAEDPSTLPGTRSIMLSQVKEMDAQFPRDNGRQFAPESWVNGKTKMLYQMADVSGSRPGDMTPRDAQVADVASAGQKIREAGPYADINAKYAAAKNESGDFREALGMNRKPAANEAVDERKAANMLARRGQSTTTAGIQRKEAGRLEEILAADPELARIADSPALLKAKADLQFHVGTPAHGGMLDRIGVPAGAVIGDLLGAAAGGGHGGLKGAALGITSALAAQNATPIAGRLLYNPARAAVPAGQELTNFSAKWNPIIQAYLAAQQRDQERAGFIADDRKRAASLNSP